GMVFKYLNDPTVWKKLCDTYEALYTYFADFDTFNASRGSGVTIPPLQDECKEFLEVALTSVLHRPK
ncbi:hypothetical protein BGZ61DRAFT_296210, partial [Ilyonectria robusta]|uniref:uncharacterized protein n=1 Tax=Ilyonectria robusta TaxID=1079257 RepID=UPI001E8E4D2B